MYVEGSSHASSRSSPWEMVDVSPVPGSREPSPVEDAGNPLDEGRPLSEQLKSLDDSSLLVFFEGGTYHRFDPRALESADLASTNRFLEEKPLEIFSQLSVVPPVLAEKPSSQPLPPPPSPAPAVVAESACINCEK